MSLAALRRGEMAGATRVDLVRCGLTAWPEELDALANCLEVLDLSGNPLTALPHGLARFTRLRVLFLSGTAIRRLPEVLGECPALSQIGLRGGSLEEIPGHALPPALRWLTVTDNALTSLPEALGTRPLLQKLLLAGNRLTALPESLADADALELLRLSANRLEGLPGWLSALPRLAWLSWAGNRFDPPPEPAGPAITWARLAGDRALGEGASGHVREMRLTPEERPVAVKLFKGRMTSDGLPEREMAAMLAVGAHPHLLPVLGRVSDHPEGRDGLVLPLLPEGMRPLAGPPSPASCTRDVYADHMRLSVAQLLAIGRGIASAMAHLHARSLCHGDLYAHNILWNGADAVLTDFGAASLLPPAPAMPRLALLESRAFGILLGELLDRCPEAVAIPALSQLASTCMTADVAARPAMADITASLSAV